MIPLAGQTLKSAHFLHPTAIAMGHRVMRVSFRDVELKFTPFATSGATSSCSLSRGKPWPLTNATVLAGKRKAVMLGALPPARSAFIRQGARHDRDGGGTLGLMRLNFLSLFFFVADGRPRPLLLESKLAVGDTLILPPKNVLHS